MIFINPIYDILIFSGLIPIITALLGLLLGRRYEKYLGLIGFIGYVTILFYLFQPDVWSIDLSIPLSPFIGSSRLSITSFTKFFIIVFALLALPAYLESIDYMEEDRNLTSYYTLIGTMMFGLIGLTFSDDLFTFFVFWEAMAISSYVLVGFRYHLDEPVEAAVKYLVISGVGSLLLLLGISYTYGLVGVLTLDEVLSFLATVNPGNVIYPILLISSLFLIGFGVKAAYFPLWTWLPDAHPAAPSPISALLSGIVIKAGILGLAKFALPFFLELSNIYYPIYLVITISTLLIANMMALLQDDIKRLLAFSSIVNIGFILIGFSIAVKGSVDIGLASAFSHILTHALGKGAAFLAVGGILYVTHTRSIKKLEGLGRVYPGLSMVLMLALFSLGGLPPLPGFWSKWLLILSAVDAGEWLLAFLGVFNSVLAILYYLWLFQRLFLSQPSEDIKRDVDIPPFLGSALLIITIFLIAFGLFPNLIYEPAFRAAKYLSNLLSGAF